MFKVATITAKAYPGFSKTYPAKKQNPAKIDRKHLVQLHIMFPYFSANKEKDEISVET